eukprot:3408818-Prymnesium_polylepis.1
MPTQRVGTVTTTRPFVEGGVMVDGAAGRLSISRRDRAPTRVGCIRGWCPPSATRPNLRTIAGRWPMMSPGG